jgi:transposase
MTPNGKITFNKAMSRAKLKEWFVKQKLSLVAMESCGGLIIGQGLLNL